MTLLRTLRPALLALLLVLAIQPVRARMLAPAYPAAVTLIAEPAPGGGDALINLIAQAQTRVLVESYAVNDPPIVAALVAARARGADVRVMADPHSASSGPVLDQLATHDVWGRRGNSTFSLTGESAVVIDKGILALSNAPLTLTARTAQQRFLVVDRDPMDVQQVASVFYDDWERRTPNRFGHHTVLAPPDYQTQLIALINQSANTIEIMGGTIASPEIMDAVHNAILRQVKARVLLDPGVPQSVLEGLVSIGAEPRLLGLGFAGSVVSIDASHLLIGSAALDDVSLLQHRELGLILSDPGVSGTFNATFETDWARAAKLAIAQPSPTPLVVNTPAISALPTATVVRRPGTPTAKPLPPTPTPVPTATPSQLTMSPLLNSTVRIGGRQIIVVRTVAGAAVTIVVTYPNGSTHNPGTSQGVGTADATGSFVDAWTIDPGAPPGTATVSITVTGLGQSLHTTTTFTIIL